MSFCIKLENSYRMATENTKSILPLTKEISNWIISKGGASIIGSAGSGKTESVVYGFLKHFRKESFCGIIHDYKDFELTEMAYPLFKDSDIPFKVISFDKIIHRVNPVAPRYLENEESVNEVSRVLIENLLEQRDRWNYRNNKIL